MDLGRRRLSASQLTKFTMCQLAWERQYILDEPGAGSWAMWVGSAVDFAVREQVRRKIAGEEAMSAEEVAEVARAHLEQRAGSGEPALLTNLEREHGGVELIAGTRVVELAQLHARAVMPTLHPVACEERLSHSPDGYDFDLLGFVDIREELEEPEGQGDLFDDPDLDYPITRVRDTKTKANLCKSRFSGPTKDDADISTQLSTYGILVEAVHGKRPESYALDFLVTYKAGPEYRAQWTTRTTEDFDRTLARYQRMVEIIDGGVFWPAEEGHWLCAADRCSYFADCEFGARGRAKPRS